ncbi:N-methyl-L-tryptophan oxidase [Rhodobacteraceae bacterium THAF1]|uniref:NAD(P)/FAD-dependent oxidoreductase n=1 Tax=Palleronia sp. THAF1 TaxID=2587842 RepID=UPI000F40B170|nr:FAD-binding oxidoreductase [Palleronia sp. THAF1]QFU08940.1 N-methyl-L-tryptophan oxidase [Palleronia sp. THAF1]VDC24328.1 N-methyl-L-tryptophan oxidase [Rhodobacteraceae bacterium THAF1]
MHATGPVTLATPVEHRGDLPTEADIVVIGGGVAGVTTALYAARSGARVVLCEKGRIAGEQSSRNWGWIRQQGRDPDEIPLVMQSVRLWQDLSRDTNGALGFQQTGTLYFASDAKTLAAYAGWAATAADLGLDSRMLSTADLAEMLPDANAGWTGALWTPSDARAEPWVAVPELARLAAREGVTIREDCAVRALDMDGGTITGVITEAGPIRAPRVVLAGGAWSATLLRNHGVDLPQLSVRATVGATDPLPEVFAGQGVDDRFAFRRRADGGYSLAPSFDHDFYLGPSAFRHWRGFWPSFRRDILSTNLRPASPRGFPDSWTTPRRWLSDAPSPFERMRVLDPPPSQRFARRMVQQFADAFPSLGPVALRKSWAGMIDCLPDMIPVIDRVGPLPGLVLLTGLSGHGFGIGPAVGRAAAALALDQTPDHDLSPFRFARFTDGTQRAAFHL